MTFRTLPFAIAITGSGLMAGCSSSEAGVTLDVSVTSHYRPDALGNKPPPNAEGVERTFVTDDGTAISLTEGFAVIESLTIVPCPQEGTALLRNIGRFLLPISIAHAHSEGSPTVLGAPLAKSLLQADGEMAAMGTLEPPPGEYCGVELEIGPADADATGLPSTTDLLGLSLRLAGRYQRLGEAEQSFVIQSGDERSITLELDEPLHLDEHNPEGILAIGMAYDGWLDGVDFALMDDATRANKALDNAAAYTHRHELETHHDE